VFIGSMVHMLAKLHTFSLLGIDALPVEVEVDVSPGAIPKTILVGLPEQAVKESLHRIERSMVNSGFVRPADRVVIDLAPAELPKSAGSFDLPIAVGILAGSGQFKSELLGHESLLHWLPCSPSWTRFRWWALMFCLWRSRSMFPARCRGRRFHRNQRTPVKLRCNSGFCLTMERQSNRIVDQGMTKSIWLSDRTVKLFPASNEM
jgi:hypothetical protein